MLTVNHYESIRKAYYNEGKSQRQIAKDLGHSRKTVKKAIRYSTPPGYGPRRQQSEPVIGEFTSIIDNWLEEDKRHPRKQRHTMQRIYQRLKDEHGYTGSYVTVTRYVKKVRPESKEVYAPLSFDRGEEGQVDWGQAKVTLNGRQTTVHLFCMRSCYSGASFVRAYEREDQVCFLDGHIRAFEFFDGVFRRLAYDNLKTAVIRRGKRRCLTDAFRGLRSHYLFDSRFCNPAKGNEKGHVENLVKYAQRNFMTPLPAVSSLEELNRQLIKKCRADLQRRPQRRDMSLREMLDLERPLMLPVPEVRYAAARAISTFADKESLVRADTNYYSVPVVYAHHPCVVKVFADTIEIHSGSEIIAEHERAEGRYKYVLNPMHYVPLLKSKPGLLKNGRPFKGEPWGPAFTRMHSELRERRPEDGDRRFIRILLLFQTHPPEDVSSAVEQCVSRGLFSDEAVLSELRNAPSPPVSTIDFSADSPWHTNCSGIRSAAAYDMLLEKEVNA